MSHLSFSGVAKPDSVEHPELIAVVLGFVQNFVPEFSAAEIVWVLIRVKKFLNDGI